MEKKLKTCKINLKKKKIINSLRLNARDSLSNISRNHKIPICTVSDNYNYLLSKEIIQKHSSIIDFESLGFSHRFFFLFKNIEENFLNVLSNEKNLNSLTKFNDSYFLADCVFSKYSQAESFFENVILKNTSDALKFSFISCIKFEETCFLE